MGTIAESNVLLRAQAEWPTGLKVATEEFSEGWNLMRAGGVGRLERKIQARGWNFIKIADGVLRGGVGATSQEAIDSALKLALRRVDAHSTAVEVQRIELTQYPWFCLARLRVHPYRIQQGPALPGAESGSDEAEVEPLEAQQRQLSRQAAKLLSQFGNAIPALKDMLTSSRSSEADAQ